MKTQAVVPVILSIVVIILVAIIEKQSKLFAALIAVMPLARPWHSGLCTHRMPGIKLAPILLTGYGVWAVGVTILYLLRNTLETK